MLLMSVGSIRFGGISLFWDRTLRMKTWYNSNIFMKFTDFFCIILLAQNVLVSPKLYTTPIDYFNQNFKTCINYRWCSMRFLVLIKL